MVAVGLLAGFAFSAVGAGGEGAGLSHHFSEKELFRSRGAGDLHLGLCVDSGSDPVTG